LLVLLPVFLGVPLGEEAVAEGEEVGSD
ncbi:MAG: hypothetical protein ACD_37C00629G0001, partial [uncultured bacterium]